MKKQKTANGWFQMEKSIKITFDGKTIGELISFKPSSKEYPKIYSLGIDGYYQLDKKIEFVGERIGSIYCSK